MDPTPETLNVGLNYVTAVCTALIGVYTWWTSRGKATEDAIKEVRAASEREADQMREDQHRLAVVTRVEHSVGERLKVNDLGELYEKMSELNREMGEINSKLGANIHQITLLQEYLMRRRSDEL